MSLTSRLSVTVERWTPDHEQFAELLVVIAHENQTDWLEFNAPWHRSSHILVALEYGQIVGFLRFVIQEIGSELERPAVRLNETPLTEAKVIAFGVIQESRTKGIGRALQQETLRWARELGCYQVRSHSGGEHCTNHALKLKMGFGVHPIVRGDDKEGVYFIMPLSPLALGDD